MEALQVDHNQLEIFIQRSWATISKEKENIALHKHLQSHLSFAYLNHNQDQFILFLFSKDSI